MIEAITHKFTTPVIKRGLLKKKQFTSMIVPAINRHKVRMSHISYGFPLAFPFNPPFRIDSP